MPRRHKGFTLIELLVVIAIIAILAAILFPVFARARAKAHQNACLSNVKQLALGLKMYMSDFDGKFPYAFPYTWYRAQWKLQIGPYVRNGQLFVCPADTVGENNTSADLMGSEDPENWQSSYGYNWCAGGAGQPCRGYPSGETALQAPAEMWILADATDVNPPYVSDGYLYNSTFVFRHNDTANFAYVDGHAKALTRNFPPQLNYNPCNMSGAAPAITRFWSGMDPQ